MDQNHKSAEHGLDEAVSRVLRDSLPALRRTSEDLNQAFADLLAACSSSRPTNSLPAMLRAQAAGASLASSLQVLSNFVTAALHPRESSVTETALLQPPTESEQRESQPATPTPQPTPTPMAAAPQTEVTASKPPAPERFPVSRWVEEMPAAPSGEAPAPVAFPEQEVPQPPLEIHAGTTPASEKPAAESTLEVPTPDLESLMAMPIEISEEAMEEFSEPVVEPPPFDIARLSPEEQELHRRANRVAKVAMQDIQLLRPDEVRAGREHGDLCARLRTDLDKARREYDRRFHTILEHPVDYFHQWMVEILAEGDPQVLGEYPYPSPALHR
jgi:hypothetical protein